MRARKLGSVSAAMPTTEIRKGKYLLEERCLFCGKVEIVIGSRVPFGFVVTLCLWNNAVVNIMACAA